MRREKNNKHGGILSFSLSLYFVCEDQNDSPDIRILCSAEGATSASAPQNWMPWRARRTGAIWQGLVKGLVCGDYIAKNICICWR